MWEGFEFTTDTFFGTHEQGGPLGANFDTMTDLLADMLGALVGATVAGLVTAYGRVRGFDSFAERALALPRRLGFVPRPAEAR
jgi:hypothetical protein